MVSFFLVVMSFVCVLPCVTHKQFTHMYICTYYVYIYDYKYMYICYLIIYFGVRPHVTQNVYVRIHMYK